ncbi:alpha/beta fold hydrolase [Synechococcus sp. CC9311]|uniref:alpha/beta fold hydrolase n=1 Tax=Synechococcus sp. (strain CC9311) TaxID=64471 RepID=UPI0000DDB203|nr:alpha/beta fold hydrolase [Synechococcus sp. CC9311]ABI45688.1 Alpha/beta hydrolase family protein [Synechococcus sp. CC9311]
MKQVIAMHGWSGDSHAWVSWIRHFKHHHWSWQSGERGYGKRQEHMPFWHDDQDAIELQRRVVIAHSLGPHLLPEAVLAQATDVVLLASFSRFVPEGPKGRALKTGLKSMRRCLGSDAEAEMLTTFLKRAAAPSSPDGLPSGPIHEGLSQEGRQRLTDDLDQLIASAELPIGLQPSTKVLVVEAEKDAIVVPAAQQELRDAVQTRLKHPAEHWCLPGSGHALLVPDLLMRIQRWLDQPPEKR